MDVEHDWPLILYQVSDTVTWPSNNRLTCAIIYDSFMKLADIKIMTWHLFFDLTSGDSQHILRLCGMIVTIDTSWKI